MTISTTYPTPFPTGWYCVGRTSELLPSRDGRAGANAVVTRPFMGGDIVLYRTGAGQLCAVEPYCPHLGAHFGHGGTVAGDELRCPFHGFRFGPDGRCTATGYDSTPPQRAVVRHYPVRDINGFLVVWHDASDRAPDWEPPAYDMSDFTRVHTCAWTLRGHAQDFAENGVDLGHLTWVHGYRSVTALGEPDITGPIMTARYGMTRPAGLFGSSEQNIEAEFEAKICGLGYSVVHVEIPAMDLFTRQWVLVTPVSATHVELRIALAVRRLRHRRKIHPAMALVPNGLATRLIAMGAFHAFKNDVQQDFPIWQNKAYVDPPRLAKGDGPINTYRRWVQQFYPDDTAAEHRGKLVSL